jgi:hypothetical protein
VLHDGIPDDGSALKSDSQRDALAYTTSVYSASAKRHRPKSPGEGTSTCKNVDCIKEV